MFQVVHLEAAGGRCSQMVWAVVCFVVFGAGV